MIRPNILYLKNQDLLIFASQSEPNGLLSLISSLQEVLALFEVRPIPYTSPGDVEVLDEQYLKVDQQIYCGGREVQGVDLASFEILAGSYAKDQHQVYYWGEVVAGADSETFGYEEKYHRYRDKEHIFSGRENCERLIGKMSVYTFRIDQYAEFKVATGNRVIRF